MDVLADAAFKSTPVLKMQHNTAISTSGLVRAPPKGNAAVPTAYPNAVTPVKNRLLSVSSTAGIQPAAIPPVTSPKKKIGVANPITKRVNRFEALVLGSYVPVKLLSKQDGGKDRDKKNKGICDKGRDICL